MGTELGVTEARVFLRAQQRGRWQRRRLQDPDRGPRDDVADPHGVAGLGPVAERTEVSRLAQAGRAFGDGALWASHVHSLTEKPPVSGTSSLGFGSPGPHRSWVPGHEPLAEKPPVSGLGGVTEL